MAREERRLHALRESAPRIVLAHAQLLQDDGFLRLVLLRVEQEALHAVGLDLERLLPAVRGQLEPICRVIRGRERVVVAAQRRRDQVDGALAEALRALEHHVLEEVRDAGFALLLVARADLVPEHQRDDGVEMALCQDHAHAVRERALLDAGAGLHPGA